MPIKNHRLPNCTVAVEQTQYNTAQPLDRAAATTTQTRTFRAFLKAHGGTSKRSSNSKAAGVGLPEVGYKGHSENVGDTAGLLEGQELTLTFDSGRVKKGKYWIIEKDVALFLKVVGSDQVIVDTSEQR